MAGKIGFEAESNTQIRHDACWFGEGQSRVVVSVRPAQVENFKKLLNEHNLPHRQIGLVGGDSIRIDGQNWGVLSEWQSTYDNHLGDLLDSTATQN